MPTKTSNRYTTLEVCSTAMKPQGVGGRDGKRRSVGVSHHGAAVSADLGGSSKYSTLAYHPPGHLRMVPGEHCMYQRLADPKPRPEWSTVTGELTVPIQSKVSGRKGIWYSFQSTAYPLATHGRVPVAMPLLLGAGNPGWIRCTATCGST